MDQINIFDNWLSDVEYKKIVDKIQALSSWVYGHLSTTGVSENLIPYWSSSLCDDTYFTEYLFDIIQKTVNQPLKLDRVYCNGLTYGQNGSFHIDADDENSRTFLLYVHDIPQEDIDIAGGYIYFKFPELDYNIAYEPIQNRGIYFPGNLLHKASAFSRFIKTMRVSIAWKMHLINSK